MPSTTRNNRTLPPGFLLEALQEVIDRQLDDMNVLAEALAAALRSYDEVRADQIRVEIQRYALVAGWNRDKCVPAALAYAKEHSEFDDDLFAPAFILKSTAPEAAQTATILAAVSEDVRALLDRALTGNCSPKPLPSPGD